MKFFISVTLGLLGWSLGAQYAHVGFPLENLDNLAFAHRQGILEDLDLRGAVYKIRVDEAPFFQSGTRRTEGRRNVRYTALFDEKGRLSEESRHDKGSNLISRGGFIPPLDGAPETFQVFRSRAQRLLHSTPTRDSDGRIVSEELVYEDGSTGRRTHSYVNGRLVRSRDDRLEENFRWDANGRLAEIVQNVSEQPPLISLFYRDSAGLLNATEQKRGSETLLRSELIRDGQGRLIRENITRMGKTYVVEFSLPDAVGNWQRRLVSETGPDGTLVPLFARYRRISYF